MEHTEQIKEMIRNEIQSIDSLKERIAFKELMEGVFLTLYEANERMYKNLEDRVINELAYDINRYQIKTGLIERNYLDQSHHLMSAVCEEDLKKPRFQAGDLRQEISSAGKVRLVTVFVQCDAIEGMCILRIYLRRFLTIHQSQNLVQTLVNITNIFTMI